MAAQNPDPDGFARYCKALNACRDLALTLYPQVKDMYPGGLLSMFSLDPSLLAPTCPIQVRAQAQEEQYAFLRELAGSLSIDPGPVPPPEVGQAAKVWRLVRLCLHLSRMLQAVKWMVPLFLMLNRRGAAC
jgi:hypothetical protein